jgi:hypothetical protein
MAASVAQSTSVQSTTGSVTATFGSAVTAGNTIVVCLSGYRTEDVPAAQITDSKGNTYSRAVTLTGNAGDSSLSRTGAIYVGLAGSGGSSFAVTANVTGGFTGKFVTIAIFEIVGNYTGVDQTASSSGSASTFPSGTTATTTSTDAIAIASYRHRGAPGALVPAFSNSFTAGPYQNPDVSTAIIATAYKVLSATGTQDSTCSNWDGAPPDVYVGVIAVFGVVIALPNLMLLGVG